VSIIEFELNYTKVTEEYPCMTKGKINLNYIIVVEIAYIDNPELMSVTFHFYQRG